ncbi:MAG: PHP domain-containing protein [Deltaproteobacteria bacterium]|nr:PHP domain-containing protein [Deltaproteobacteria bacterium]
MVKRRRAFLCALVVAALAGAACDVDRTGSPDADGADAVDAGPDVATDAPTGDATDDAELPGPVCPPAPVPTGEVRARAIGSCAADRPQGPLAGALPGDLVLENARARFVVRSRDEGLVMLGLRGGSLIDAVLLDPDGAQRGDDGLRELTVACDFWLLEPESVRVEASGEDGEARVSAEGPLRPFTTVLQVLPFDEPELRVRQTYVLRPDSAVLEIRTRFFALPAWAGAPAPLMDLMFWGGDSAPWLPGASGFALPSGGRAPLLAFASPRGRQTVPAAASGSAAPRDLLAVGPVLAVNYDPIPLPGGEGEVVRWLALGGEEGGRDLASALASARAALGESSTRRTGTVQPPYDGVEVVALDEAGHELARCDVDEAGRFDCPLPPATAALATGWTGDGMGGLGGDGQVATDLAVPVSTEGELTLQTSPPARLRLEVSDGETQPLAFRATLIAADPGATLSTRQTSDGTGSAELLVPAGVWRVVITGGPERDWHDQTLTLGSGELTTLVASLPRVVDSDGWVAAELHAHSEASTDSRVPYDRRLVEAMGEGLDYLVTSEHDFVSDPTPWLLRAGRDDRLMVRTGVESSPMRLGHFNVWPLEADPERAGMGAPDWYEDDLDQWLDRLHARVPDGVVQCNHPRFEGGYAAFFEAAGLDDGIDAPRYRCDAIEVINGYAVKQTAQVLADWLALDAAGVRITATGSSDSHESGDLIGGARTLVHVGLGGQGLPLDSPGLFTGPQVEAAIRGGRAVATAGPLLELRVETVEGRRAGVGETLTDPGAEVTVRVRLEAPAWMALDTLVLQVDGQVVREEDVSAAPLDGRTRRIVWELPLAVGGVDHRVVAWHRSAVASPPGTRWPAWAIANPVRIDGDGDGR